MKFTRARGVGRWLIMFGSCTLLSCTSADGEQGWQRQFGTVKQPEVWSHADNPSIFGAGLERRLDLLPMEGEVTRIPWPGSYWPTRDDSINYRWDGPQTDSAVKKFEKAFSRPGLEDAISRQFGVDSCVTCKTCTSWDECDSSKGESCAKRVNTETGRCMPSWWGLCHGWAPAAILWSEPQHEVVRNGVTFKVQDLKALATAVFDRTLSRFVSMRCNRDDYHNDIVYDDAGRPEPSECRDSNAGTYHLLITNYLGIKNQSFIEDRRFDMQVWNQPLRGFRVVEKREISALEANRLLGIEDDLGDGTDADSGLDAGLEAGDGSDGDGGASDASPRTVQYRFNRDARSLAYVRIDVSYIGESGAGTDGSLYHTIDSYTMRDQYEYILELDASGGVVGGEWVGYSKRSHPDFLWLPTGPGRTSVADGQIRYSEVKELLEESSRPR